MKDFFKLTLLEIKKLVCKKYVLAMLLLLMIAMGWYINTYFKVDMNEWKDIINVYKPVEGRLNVNKYNQLIQKNNELKKNMDEGDSNKDESTHQPVEDDSGNIFLIKDVLAHCDFVLKNENNRKKIVQMAKNNIRNYSNAKDRKYELEFNRKVLSKYEKQPQVYVMNKLNKTMWEAYLMFGIHSPIIILFLLIVIIPVFAGEKENGMQSLIDTYAGGKNKLFFSKVLAVIFTSAGVAVTFEGMALLFFKLTIPSLNGLGYTIQTICPQCPYNLTIGQAILVKILYIVIASITVGMGIMMFSAVFRKIILSMGFSIVFAIATYGVVFYRKIWNEEILREAMLDHTNEKFETLKTYMFTYLFYPYDYLKKFQCVKFCGKPFFPQTIVICISIGCIIFFSCIAYVMYTKPKKKIS